VAPSPVSHLSAVPHAPGPAGGAVVVVSGVVVVVFVSGVVVSVVVSFAAFAAFAFASTAAASAVYFAFSGTFSSTGIFVSGTGAASANAAGTVVHSHYVASLTAEKLGASATYTDLV